MGYTIFITEKPSVAQDYARCLQVQREGRTNGYIQGFSNRLGKDVKITWAVGHLIRIATPAEQRAGRALSLEALKQQRWKKDDLPILPQKYLYLPIANVRQQFEIIKGIYESPTTDAIYYAGDSGQEGIYIQALIRNQIFGGKDPKGIDEKVVWIDSCTDEEILRGINTAKPYHAYDDMIAAGYARGIKDYTIGMNFSEGISLKSGSTISVGRVMSPTLAIIVERQREIDNFVATDYYGINAVFNGFTAKWKVADGSKYVDSPLLYNDSGFLKQEDAENLIAEDLNNDKNFKVMDVKVQDKKELAPLLYNLTDLQAFGSKSLHITPKQTLEAAQRLYEGKYITYPRTDARVLSSAVAKDIKAKLNLTVPSKYIDDKKITDHYAIIPTFIKPEGISGIDAALYKAILHRFKAIFMPAYIYQNITAVLVNPVCPTEKFYISGKNEQSLGWKSLYQDEGLKSFAPPQKGQILIANSVEINAMQTKPPTPYTTGDMVKVMEKAGKLIEDEELREQIKTCGIGTPATRDGVIEKLNTKGYITIDPKTQRVAPTEYGKQIIPIIAMIDESLVSPEATAKMQQRLEDIKEGRLSYEEEITFNNKYILDCLNKIENLSGIKLAARNVSGGSGSKNTPKGTYDCPCCKATLKYGKFGWYCENKDFSFGLEIAGHKMKESDLKDILTKGATKKLKFKSKAGKPFEASLVLKSDGKTEFCFNK